MYTKTLYSVYDTFASIYDAQNTKRHDIVVAQLEKLVLQHLPKDAHILDVGCGTGQIAQRLLKKGYQVTGIDGSEEMLSYARKNAPSANFILEDARYFQLPPIFHTVISTDVTFNHMLSLEDLQSVFKNVYQALLNNGIFVFELFVIELCEEDWKLTNLQADVEDDNAWISQFKYDEENKIGTYHTTKFILIDEKWQRFNINFSVKLYTISEIKSSLEKVGFQDIVFYDIKTDFGIEPSANIGCFMCYKR